MESDDDLELQEIALDMTNEPFSAPIHNIGLDSERSSFERFREGPPYCDVIVRDHVSGENDGNGPQDNISFHSDGGDIQGLRNTLEVSSRVSALWCLLDWRENLED